MPASPDPAIQCRLMFLLPKMGFRRVVEVWGHLRDHLQTRCAPPTPILMWPRQAERRGGGGCTGDSDPWVRSSCGIDQHFSNDTVCVSPLGIDQRAVLSRKMSAKDLCGQAGLIWPGFTFGHATRIHVCPLVSSCYYLCSHSVWSLRLRKSSLTEEI